MRVDGLAALSVFVRVVETGGFSAAATSLGLSPSAVSYSVRQLEKQSGTKLLNRTTRSVGLTEAGQRFFHRISPMVAEMQSAIAELSSAGTQPAGNLRLTMSRSAFEMFLEPVMNEFLLAFPNINIDVSISSVLTNIVSGGFDAGIRHSDYLEQDMLAIPLTPQVRTAFVASPDYLERMGIPLQPSDLLAHECIRYRSGVTGKFHPWALGKAEDSMLLDVDGRVSGDDAAVMLKAAISGCGIACLWDRYTEDYVRAGTLVRLLEDWSPIVRFSLFYFNRGHVPQKLRALIDFMTDRVPRGDRLPDKA